MDTRRGGRKREKNMNMKNSTKSITMSTTKVIHAYARTTLRSGYYGDGKPWPYALHVTVDESGKIRFVEEKTDRCAPRPYILIHLADQILEECKILLPSGLPKAKWVENPALFARNHPALEVAGKRYRLDQVVSGSWISNPAIRSMVEYVRALSEREGDEDENEDSLFAHLLSKHNSLKWEIVYQEE